MGSLQDIKGHFYCHGITNFTAKEVEDTGANLSDVKLILLRALQEFRNKINRRVMLIPNGLTTGNHASREHPEGIAVDFWLHPDDGPVEVRVIKPLLIRSGFNGIGVYWNGVAYSFHADLRPLERYAEWTGEKGNGEKSWTYKVIVGNTVNMSDPGR